MEDKINPEGRKAVIGALDHLKVIGAPESSRADWAIHLNYVDVLLDIYGCDTTVQETDISKVVGTLDPSHFGLPKIKQRIYNYLGTKILNPKSKGPTPCFVGPPGVGKTSIGKSIAEALGRKFIRISLGGIRDEADIRGHRRTYIGAVPGEIIEQIKRCGVRNPVFMFDEIDKLVNNSINGNPAAALLEVLDPEQNHSFRDHYVDAPFDLSEVLFLCTANMASDIPLALRDRMDIISISGYTEYEKIQIAKEYLIPEQVAETGFPADEVEIKWENDNPDLVLSEFISGYTREAGVRDLKRQIYRVFSSWNWRYLKEGRGNIKELVVSPKLLEELLGPKKYRQQRANITVEGEIIGLAWTPVGGDIMYVQSAIMGKDGETTLSLTGLQGEVMRQATKVALSRLRKKLEEAGKVEMLKSKLIHVHFPEGAVPKDGPSAGITAFCSLYSAAFKKIARPYVAMTGELTLSGMVTAIGGVKEKVLAAYRDGIREIILPDSNRDDVENYIPKDIKKDIKFHFVSSDEEVLNIIFSENPVS